MGWLNKARQSISKVRAIRDVSAKKHKMSAQKGRIHGNAKGGRALNFGAFGSALDPAARITARQIEAARRAITRHTKRALCVEKSAT